MTGAAHVLAIAIVATFGGSLASREPFALACVTAARASGVSSCDVAAVAMLTSDAPSAIAASLARARHRCGSRGLALAALDGSVCRDVHQRGFATRALGIAARLCAVGGAP